MEAVAAKISSKYQVVLPKPVREALGLRTGDSLLFLVDGDTVLLRPRPASFTVALRGLHREAWAEVDLNTWLDQERASWE